MAERFDSRVQVTREGSSAVTINLDANGGNVSLGGSGVDGDLLLRDNEGNNRITLDAQGQNITVRSADGSVVVVLGSGGNLTLGGNGQDGDLLINGSDGKQVMHLNGDGANLYLGGNGKDGDIVIFPNSTTDTSDLAQASIHLDGDAGDITLRNADCAEEFDVGQLELVEPGTVMVIHQDGKLWPCDAAGDRRVAGVVSGAGEYKPALVLDRQPTAEPRAPIALVGKVYCKVDASYGPVQVGDLLTTSRTPGHAQVARDAVQAFGAVLGKALAPLPSGQGLIPILIALQ